MKCDKARELFSDQLEGTLDNSVSEALAQHFTECSACEHEYNAFESTWQILESMPEVEPPVGFAWEVTMKARMQRDAVRCTKPKWQTWLSERFATGVPARVLAGGLALFLCGQVFLNTPSLRNAVGAWLISAPATAKVAQAPKPVVSEPAKDWLYSGLNFELDRDAKESGRGVFRLIIKPSNNAKTVQARVYLMGTDEVNFSKSSRENAARLFDGAVSGSGQVIPFVLGKNGGAQEVTTALIEWKNDGRHYEQAAFVPSQISSAGISKKNNVSFTDLGLYNAMQKISETYGVVILINADIKDAKVSATVSNGSADDALYEACSKVGLRWRSLGSQAYIIERVVE